MNLGEFGHSWRETCLLNSSRQPRLERRRGVGVVPPLTLWRQIEQQANRKKIQDSRKLEQDTDGDDVVGLKFAKVCSRTARSSVSALKPAGSRVERPTGVCNWPLCNLYAPPPKRETVDAL